MEKDASFYRLAPISCRKELAKTATILRVRPLNMKKRSNHSGVCKRLTKFKNNIFLKMFHRNSLCRRSTAAEKQVWRRINLELHMTGHEYPVERAEQSYLRELFLFLRKNLYAREAKLRFWRKEFAGQYSSCFSVQISVGEWFFWLRRHREKCV